MRGCVVLDGPPALRRASLACCVACMHSWLISGVAGVDKQSFGFGGTGKKSFDKQFDTYGAAFGLNDVIGCALDMDAGAMSFRCGGGSCAASHRIMCMSSQQERHGPGPGLRGARQFAPEWPVPCMLRQKRRAAVQLWSHAVHAPAAGVMFVANELTPR